MKRIALLLFAVAAVALIAASADSGARRATLSSTVTHLNTENQNVARIPELVTSEAACVVLKGRILRTRFFAKSIERHALKRK